MKVSTLTLGFIVPKHLQGRAAVLMSSRETTSHPRNGRNMMRGGRIMSTTHMPVTVYLYTGTLMIPGI